MGHQGPIIRYWIELSLLGIFLVGIIESQAIGEELAYGARSRITTVPYSEQSRYVADDSHSIKRGCEDMGGCPPTRIEPAGPGRVWIGLQGVMPIYIVDINTGQVVHEVNLGDLVLSSGLHLDRELYSDFARDPEGHFYVLMTSVATQEHPSLQVMIKLDSEGHVLRDAVFPELALYRHSDFVVDSDHRFWIPEGSSTRVFTAEGKTIFSIPRTGVLLDHGPFLSHQPSSKETLTLYDQSGNYLGPVSGNTLPQFLYWTPKIFDHIVVRMYVGPQKGIPASLTILELYQLNENTKKLELFDFLVEPAPKKDSQDNGFLGFTFEKNGDILTMQDGLYINRHSLLQGPNAWRKKFKQLPESKLSPAEIRWHQAELLAHTGKMKPNHPLYPFFSRCRWFQTAMKNAP